MYDTPGLYAVRAVPQVVTGCDDGVPRLSTQGGEAGQAGVEVR